MKSFLFLVSLGFLTLSPLSLKAQSNYTVSHIEISIAGAPSKETSLKAQKEASHEAFKRLIEQITGKNISEFKTLTHVVVDDLVSSVEVVEEKQSPDNYFAIFDVEFSPQEVAHLLHKKNIAMNHTQEISDIVVIPVLHNHHETLLWDEKNIWHNAWNNSTPDTSFKVHVPFGDAEDQKLIAVTDVMHHEIPKKKLVTFAGHYHVQDILIAKLDVLDGALALSMFLPLQHKSLPSVSIKGNLDEGNLIKAVKEALEAYQKHAQERISTPTTQAFDYKIVAQIGSLQEFLAVKQSLQKNPLIKNIRLLEISHTQANFNLQFHGNMEELEKECNKIGFSLTNTNNICYIRKMESTIH